MSIVILNVVEHRADVDPDGLVLRGAPACLRLGMRSFRSAPCHAILPE